MAIFLTTYRSSLVPLIQAIEHLKDKEEIAKEAEAALSAPSPTSLIAIQIISGLGERVSTLLRQQNLEELAKKVHCLTAEHILSACLQLRSDKHGEALIPSAISLGVKHEVKTGPNILEVLSQQVLCHIFSFIDPLNNVALTCRAFRDCAQLVKASRILSQPLPRISLLDFGLTLPTQELDCTVAHRFLYQRQKILEVIKRSFSFQLIQDIDSQPKPFTISQFVDFAYSVQIIQLFGRTLSVNYHECHAPVSYIQNEISSLRDKIAASGKTFTMLEYINKHEPLTCIPKAIRFCTTLATLHISNSLIRTLPNEIRNLKRLETLSLGKNCLVELPQALGECTQLRWIDIGFNLLKTIPSSILSLPRLETFTADEDVVLPQEFTQTHTVVQIDRERVLAYRVKVYRHFGIPLP
jgi:hypothetical protein